jgi:hypothetical protein
MMAAASKDPESDAPHSSDRRITVAPTAMYAAARYTKKVSIPNSSFLDSPADGCWGKICFDNFSFFELLLSMIDSSLSLSPSPLSPKLEGLSIYHYLSKSKTRLTGGVGALLAWMQAILYRRYIL